MTLPPYHVSTITNDDDDTPNLTEDEKLDNMLATQMSLKAKIADHKANANSDTSAVKFLMFLSNSKTTNHILNKRCMIVFLTNATWIAAMRKTMQEKKRS